MCVCWLLWGRPEFKSYFTTTNPWITDSFGNTLRSSLQSHSRRLMGEVRTQMSTLTRTGNLLLGLIYHTDSKLIDGIQHTTNLVLRSLSQEGTSHTYFTMIP